MVDVKVDLVCDLWTLCSFHRLAHEEKGGGQDNQNGNDQILDARHDEKRRAQEVC